CRSCGCTVRPFVLLTSGLPPLLLTWAPPRRARAPPPAGRGGRGPAAIAIVGAAFVWPKRTRHLLLVTPSHLRFGCFHPTVASDGAIRQTVPRPEGKSAGSPRQAA